MVVSSGVLSGLIASFFMSGTALVGAALDAKDFWGPVGILVGLFMPLHGGVPSVPFLLATVVHLVVGAALGVLFAALVPARSRAPAIIGAGLAFGVVVFFVVTYGFLHALDARITNHIDAYWFFLEHAVFGLALGIGVAVWRWARRPQAPATHAL
jgi:hypothetical protein